MSNKLAVLLLLLLAAHSVLAQKKHSTDVSSIPDSLMKDAHAVYRLDEAVLDVLSPSRYNLQVHQVVTIINAEGAGHLRHRLGLNKFHKVDDVEIKVYNKAGMEVQRYSKKNFELESAYDDISFVTDNKVMHLFTPAPGYPCTIDVYYKINVTSYIELPDWYVNTDKKSTEIFRYTIRVPATMDIRYRSLNMKLEPAVSVQDKQKVYTWEARNLVARKMDRDGYEQAHYLPQVQVAPNYFEYDGHKGAFSTWKDFGKWNYDLYEEKKPFTEQRIAEIKALAGKAPDKRAKIQELYKYLQENMRYVSIQLGIGGFKPFPVRFVDEKKYGDCKALTNYMRYMLAVEGILSYPALINAGYNKVPADQDFPSDPFNHVILCIPDHKDTIWLECTSSSNSMGFLGSATENKNALLLTEEGGVLVKTPKSSYSHNVLSSRTELFLDEEGGARVESSIQTLGSFYNLFYEGSKLSEERQKEIFVKFLNYRQPDKFHLAPKTGARNNFSLDLFYEKLYDFKAGNKFFFQPRVSKFEEMDLNKSEERMSEYLFPHPYEKRDTTVYHLPLNFTVASVPAKKSMENAYISYYREVSVDARDQKLKVISHLVLKDNIIPGSHYSSVAEVFGLVNREDSDKIILVKTK